MISFDANKVLERIREMDKDKLLDPYLEAHAAEFARLGAVPFSMAEIADWCQAASLDAEATAAMNALAADILADPAAAFMFFHCKRLVYDLVRIYPKDSLAKWPPFSAFFPGRESLFLLLVGLAAVPEIQRAHRAIGVAPDITRDTCSDIASRIEISREFRNGEIGISAGCLTWLRNHAQGDLFQFGRIQFCPCIMSQPLSAWRRRRDGEVLLLSEPGQRFTQAGFYDGAGGKLAPDAWVSVWEQKDGRLTANPFNARGRAERQPVTIALDEWRLAVDRSSTMLDTHIPRGKKITLADWREATRRGFEFFRTLRAANAPAACLSKSWMFDPVLQDLLPENTGLVALQRRLHIFPLCTGDTRCGFIFIFGNRHVDLATAPRDTSLRRALIDFSLAGGAFSGGGMLAFEDEVLKWQD